MPFLISLIIKKCIVGTLALGLAGSGTNNFRRLRLKIKSTGRQATPLRLHF